MHTNLPGWEVDRLRGLPSRVRETFEQLSPRASWPALRPPVLWLHDANDLFEPIAEADAAVAARRDGLTELTVSHLIAHASPIGQDEPGGPGFWITEIWTLIGFGLSVLRAGG